MEPKAHLDGPAASLELLPHLAGHRAPGTEATHGRVCELRHMVRAPGPGSVTLTAVITRLAL